MNKDRGWADLHVHTTASDGELTPAQVVEAAARAGLAAVGICDHDTVDGLEEGLAAGRRLGIEVVPGVELNCNADSATEVHVLGYYVDRRRPEFTRLLADLKAARSGRGEEMVRRLRAVGLPVTWERVREIAGAGSVGRPHVAQALLERGLVHSLQQAFDEYLEVGRPGYVPRFKLSPAETVRLVRRSGGAAVLAHPGLIGRDALIHELLPAGLQGLEVFHPDHDEAVQRRYLALCRELGLIVTGGSDYHGPRFGHPAPGVKRVALGAVEQLRRAAGGA